MNSGMLSKGKGGSHWNRKRIEGGYIAGKQRLKEALASDEGKSFGMREEHRMTLDLLFQVSGQIQAWRLDINWLNVTLKKTSFYVYPTKDVLNFLLGNISKFAYGFEHSLLTAPSSGISGETSKMAIMFLHFMRASYESFPIQLDFGMWLDIGREEEGERPRSQGVGLKETVAQLGYGFIKSGKVDWNAWAFASNVTEAILFRQNALAKVVGTSRQRIKEVTGIHTRYRTVFTWLADLLRQKRDEAVPAKKWSLRELFDAASAVWRWISQILIWEFQKEVLDAAKASLLPNRTPDEWIPNQIKFSRDGIKSIWHREKIVFVDNPERSPMDRARHLWCWEDGRARVKWDRKKYRVLYREIVLFWNQHLEVLGWKWSHTEFLKFFTSTCWIWPNNTTQKWFTLKQGERVWFSLSERTKNWKHPNSWISGHQDDTKSGLPSDLTIKFLTMEPDALMAHIRVRAGFSACFGWDTYQQYGWNWGWDIGREDVAKGEQVQRKQKTQEREEEEVIFLRE